MCASSTHATAVMPPSSAAPNVAATSGTSDTSATRPYTSARPSALSSVPTVTCRGRITAHTPRTASGAAIGAHASPSSASVNGSAAALRTTPAGQVASAIIRSAARNAGRTSSPRWRMRRERRERDLAYRLGDRVVGQRRLPEGHRVPAEVRGAEHAADGDVVGVLGEERREVLPQEPAAAAHDPPRFAPVERRAGRGTG